MIPLVDDYIQLFIVEKLKWLKQHPIIIDRIFRTGRRETISKLKDFLVNRKVKVIIGYPKEPSSLPAYVITLAPEAEQPLGLGDDSECWAVEGIGQVGSDDYCEGRAEEKLSEFIAGTYMNSNYRIECWADNADLCSYMYIILKWCIWSSRQQMLKMGWVNITVNGTDLEPVPDYFPIFVYRRALQINLMYENLYYEEIPALNDFVDVIEHPENYHPDKDNNVVRDEDNVTVIPAKYVWILRAHYYRVDTGDEYYVKEYTDMKLTGELKPNGSGGLTTVVVDDLPETGQPNVMYFVTRKDQVGAEDGYVEYMWINNKFEPVGMTGCHVDLSKYATIQEVEEKDEVVLDSSKTYTDSKEYTAEDVGIYDLGATEVNNAFNIIFGKKSK